MTLKDDLINRLQDEVIFLQTTQISNLEKYKYKLKGDLSESRTI